MLHICCQTGVPYTYFVLFLYWAGLKDEEAEDLGPLQADAEEQVAHQLEIPLLEHGLLQGKRSSWT